MNSTPRTATRGGSKPKSDSGSGKGHKSDLKRDGPKNNDTSKAQASERIAHTTDSVMDESIRKKKVAQVMNVIAKTEDEVMTALHDCDYDVVKAVDILLEGQAQGEWETSGKKKKNRQANASKGGEGGRNQAEGDGDEGEAPPLAVNQDRERSRGRGGGAPRLRGRGGGDNRGPGRVRENKENEGSGGDDGFRGGRGDGYRRGGRGMSNGPGGRGGRGGRGGGGRLGSRTFQGRDGREGRDRSDVDRFPSTIDTWNPAGSQDNNEKPPKMETWGDSFPAPEDWDNEEYTGSLADSKVFTPSALETSVVAPEPLQETSNQDLLSMATSSGQDYRQTNALPPSPLPVGVGALSTAQAQYLTQLTQQSAENMKASTAAATAYGQAESLKSAVGISSSGSYAQSAGYSQTGSYGQTSYPPSAYAAASGQYPAAGNAYSSATSAPGNTYSASSSTPGNAYSSASAATGNAYSSTSAVVNAYSSATSAPANAYSPASSAPANAYSSATSAPANAYSTATAPPVNAYSSATAAPANVYSSTTSVPVNAYSAASSAPSNAYSSGSSGPGNAYSGGNGAFPSSNSSSFGVYPSSGGSYSTQGYSASTVSYDGTNATSDASVPTAQPSRAKTQRPRVPPPSKIPSSAVEMPEDPISASVSSLDVQFGCLEFGSDGATFETGAEQGTKFTQPPPPASVAGTDAVPSVAPTTALDITASQQANLNAFSAAKNAAAVSSQQSSLVGGLTGKGLANNESLSIQSSGDHKSSYNAQPARAASSTSGLDLTKSDVSNLSYASAPSTANYSTYQNQKSSSSVYQPVSYSAGSYTAPQTTYSNAVPSSYSTTSYNSQPSANNSFPNSSYSSQPPNTANYAGSGVTYPSANSFQNVSQNYQSGAASVYGAALSSAYAASGYQNSYSGSSASTGKLNAGLNTTKESQEYASNSTSASTTTANTTASLLTSSTTPQAATTSSSKISTGAMKSSVVPSLHPQIMGAPQYIMSGASVPFYHQTPMYGFEDVQLQSLQLQRIPHMPTGYYDMGYTAPTSLATGRDSLPNVAYTMADARYSTRGDNNASPVPSTLSQQQTATAHQQPMMNHPSFPPGYTYVYNAVPGSFQYTAPLFPVPSAGNAHGTSSNQYGKPASYGSTYGSGYDGMNQSADYSKSAYVSAGVKSGVGGASVSSATTASDLYSKAHTALGKVNSYDKQGFHSATPPPFNMAGGQTTGMAASGAYPPQLFIPALPPHQQHHNTQLIPAHLQDSSNSSGQRSQSAVQASKSGNKQNYNTYWSPN